MNVFYIVIRKVINAPRKIRIIFFLHWNRMLFRIKGVSYGNRLKVSSSIYLQLGNDNSKIVIGDNFTFTSGDCFNPLCRNIKGCLVAYPNASIIIGNNVGMSSPCLWSHERIIIGNNVKIGGDCVLMDTDAHSLYYLDRRIGAKDRINKRNLPITIEDDVLIGARCIVLKGVTIGARSVIGSGSVVTKSIPQDCIAAGNPCKVIKYLDEK